MIVLLKCLLSRVIYSTKNRYKYRDEDRYKEIYGTCIPRKYGHSCTVAKPRAIASYTYYLLPITNYPYRILRSAANIWAINSGKLSRSVLFSVTGRGELKV